MATSTATASSPDLWREAYDRLDARVTDRLARTKTHVRDIVGETLKEAQTKRDDSTKRQLRLPNGIIVRDVMEKTIYWINCFKAVGDNAVQHDPGYAALPWAAFRFVLQAVVNDSETEWQILAQLELVTRLLAIFGQVEKLYLYLNSNAMPELRKALVEAYVAILETLAYAVKFLRESAMARVLKAPFRVPEGKTVANLVKKEQEVFKLTRLIDGSRMVEMSLNVERFVERSKIADKAVEGQKYRAILDWLSKTNYRQHHGDLSGMRSPGTGEWLLQHHEYVSWQQLSSCSLLVVHGIQGCGKTILCSGVIDELMNSKIPTRTKAPVAFFYCSADPLEPDRSDPTNVLRSLVRQLMAGVSQSGKVHSALVAAYDDKLKESNIHGFDVDRLSTTDCENMILQALEDNPATIVIDAIDEMGNPRELLRSLKSICKYATNVLKVLLSSRDPSVIEDEIPAAEPIPAVLRIRVTAKDNHLDVATFVKQRVDELAAHGVWPSHLRDNVVRSLCDGAGEMFQWAKLQLSQLEASEDPGIERDLEARLSKLRISTLDELYGSIFRKILTYESVAREMAIHAFSWLLFAKEPFTASMFLAATAEAVGWSEPNPEGLVSICRGFVYIDSQSKFVRIVHDSARVFLQGTPEQFARAPSQSLIASRCLSLLEKPPKDDIVQLRPTEVSYDYATLYCGQHLSQVDWSSGSDSLVLLERKAQTFFYDEQDVGIYAEIWMTNAKTAFDTLPMDHPQKSAVQLMTSESCSPVFPICAFGLMFILETHSWPAAFDWNQVNSRGYTTLYIATYSGHNAVVSFLLDRGADPNITCGRLGNALQCAAYLGHVDIVEILCARGADARLPGKFESSLHAACHGDQEAVVDTLLSNGFPLSTQDEYDAALLAVTKAGFSSALEKLEIHSLSNTSPSNKKQQQVKDAIAGGNLALLSRLLRQSAFDDLVAKDSLALSALQGQLQMAEFLIDSGIDVDEPGSLGTPLRCASAYGHNQICSFLIKKGAVVNKNGPFGPALHTAAMRGHLHTAKLLLDKGADVNAQGGHFGTPLQAAAYHGHMELVNLFLDAKATFHLAGFSKDAIHAAFEGGQYRIAQMLLDAGWRSLTKIDQSYPSADCRIGVPPPRNVLRECSPRRSRFKVQHLGTRSAAPEVIQGTKTKVDPLDPGHDPRSLENLHAQQGKVPKVPRTALVPERREIVSLARFDEAEHSLRYYSFIAACRHGHTAIVENMLECLTFNSQDTFDGLRAACLRNDSRTTRSLLSAVMKLDNAAFSLRCIMEMSLPEDPLVFLNTLEEMTASATQHESEALLLEYLPYVSYVGWSDMVREMLERLPNVSVEDLMDAFQAGRCSGSVGVVSVICESLPKDAIATKQWNHYARLAAQDEYADLLSFCLLRCDTSQMEASLARAIFCAAGDGALEILTQLTSYCKAEDRGSETLTKALVIAAYKGHHDVCVYLLTRGASVYDRVSTYEDEKLLVSGDWVPRKAKKWSDSSCPERLFPFRGDKDERRYRLHDAKGIVRVPQALQRLNCLEACLAGYGRFTEYSKIKSSLDSRWGHANKTAHAKTIVLLVNHIEGFQEPSWAYAVCRTAEVCSIDILELILAKGANSRASFGGRSALVCAASRETLAFPAVQALTKANAANGLEEDDMRQLLGAAVALFDDQNGERELFPMAESAKDIFISGPGAVIAYFLTRLSDEQALNKRHSLVLLMAAAAGQYDTARLLIQRGVNSDGIGSYYGTALKAACRFGHSDVAKVLLESGANHTIFEGERVGTALQLAVDAHSFPTVVLLLEFGAHPDTVVPKRRSIHRRDIYGELARRTPLSLAVREEQAAIAHALIDAGADVNTMHEGQQPILIEACAWGNTEVVERLLLAGANVHIQGQKERCTLEGKQLEDKHGSPMHAAIHGGHLHIVKLLLTQGSNIMPDPGKIKSPLAFAAAQGDALIVEALLTAAPMSASQYVGAMEIAAELSHTGITRKIFDHVKSGLKFSEIQKLCETISRTADCSFVLYLLERLRQCNAPSGEHGEAVRFLVCNGHPTIVKQLFSYTRNFLTFPDHLNSIRNACEFSDHSLIASILENLGQRSDLANEQITTSLDTGGMSTEVLKTVLSHVPCTVDIFVEACVRGNDDIVRIGVKQGYRADDEDGKSRPALHFAAAYGNVSTVQLLLADGASSRAAHPIHGTPIEIALVASAANKLLSCEAPDESDRSYLKEMPDLSYPFSEPLSNARKNAARKTIVSLLLAHEEYMVNATGRFGSILSLAAFLGWSEICAKILAQRPYPWTPGSVLPSPLVVAVKKNHSHIAAMVLRSSTAAPTDRDPDMQALILACENASLPLVKLLLKHGYDNIAVGKQNPSALTASINNLALVIKKSRGSIYDGRRQRSDGNQVFDDAVEISSAETIVKILLEADPAARVSESEMISACDMPPGNEQNALLKTLFARLESSYMPEEAFTRLLPSEEAWTEVAFIRLLRSKNSSTVDSEPMAAWLMCLQDKRVSEVTTRMFAVVGQSEVVTRLLDYDKSYIADPDTIDTIGTKIKPNPRWAQECIETLLLRFRYLVPTESNFLRVLGLRDSHSHFGFGSPDKPSAALALMFTRNPKLQVTESLLGACKNAHDLKTVLNHVEAEGKVAFESLLDESMVDEGDIWSRMRLDARASTMTPEMMIMLLDHKPSTHVSPRVAGYILAEAPFEDIERILDQRAGLCLTGDALTRMVKDSWVSVQRHCGIVGLLRKYADQSIMSGEVRTAVDDRFGENEAADQSIMSGEVRTAVDDRFGENEAIKRIYYDFAGW